MSLIAAAKQCMDATATPRLLRASAAIKHASSWMCGWQKKEVTERSWQKVGHEWFI